jgi:hypothetical protein
MFVAKPLAEQAGFKFWKPLIWDKQKIGMGYHYRARYECVLFFEKGKRKLHDLGIADIIEQPGAAHGDHATPQGHPPHGRSTRRDQRWRSMVRRARSNGPLSTW